MVLKIMKDYGSGYFLFSYKGELEVSTFDMGKEELNIQKEVLGDGTVVEKLNDTEIYRIVCCGGEDIVIHSWKNLINNDHKFISTAVLRFIGDDDQKYMVNTNFPVYLLNGKGQTVDTLHRTKTY